MTKIDGWYNDDPADETVRPAPFEQDPNVEEFVVTPLDEPSMDDYPEGFDTDPTSPGYTWASEEEKEDAIMNDQVFEWGEEGAA